MPRYRSVPPSSLQPCHRCPPPATRRAGAPTNFCTAVAAFTRHREELFSDEFIFRGPAIGPLNRADYLQILGTFGIYTAFPDIKPNAFGFTVDPEDPSRVWFLVRNSGTNTGPLGLGLGLSWPASGNAVEGAPETFSIKFDADGRVKLLTVGYVADRFEGNTGGSGAALGLMKVAGLVPLGFSASNPLFQLAQKFGDAVNYPARTHEPTRGRSEVVDRRGARRRGMLAQRAIASATTPTASAAPASPSARPAARRARSPPRRAPPWSTRGRAAA